MWDASSFTSSEKHVSANTWNVAHKQATISVDGSNSDDEDGSADIRLLATPDICISVEPHTELCIVVIGNRVDAPSGAPLRES